MTNELHATVARCSQLDQANYHLMDQTSGLNQTVADLSSEVNAARVEINNLTVTCNNLTARVGQLDQANAALTDQVAHLNAIVADLTA